MIRLATRPRIRGHDRRPARRRRARHRHAGPVVGCAGRASPSPRTSDVRRDPGIADFIQPALRIDLRRCRSSRTLHVRPILRPLTVAGGRFSVRTRFSPPARAMKVRLRFRGRSPRLPPPAACSAAASATPAVTSAASPAWPSSPTRPAGSRRRRDHRRRRGPRGRRVRRRGLRRRRVRRRRVRGRRRLRRGRRRRGRGRRRALGGATLARPADVAQLVEHFTRNEGVAGSSPAVGFALERRFHDRERRSCSSGVSAGVSTSGVRFTA